jgi:hypothetical protein
MCTYSSEHDKGAVWLSFAHDTGAVWLVDGAYIELLGFLPDIIRKDDPRPVAEQVNDRYAHGGGWRPMRGWELDRETYAITYLEDPPYKPIAATKIKNEFVLVYPHAWVAVVQENGAFEVARMD